MTDPKNGGSKGTDHRKLRERAEEILQKEDQSFKEMSGTELSTLIHELQVHQIELELQNTTLLQAQIETQHAYQRYRDLWDHSPTAYLTIDSHLRVTNINEAGRFLFGRTGEAMQGKRFISLLQSDDRVPVHLLLERTIPGGVSERREVAIERPDGNVRQCLLVCYAPESNPDDEFVLITLTDITEQKQAEIELKKRGEQLRLALEAGRIGLWDRNMVTDEIEWSAELYELLGRDPDGPAITGETFFDYIHPDDIDRVRAHLDGWLEKNDMFLDEFRVVRDDGQVRWLASAGLIHCNESGDPVRLLGINYDTTPQKEHEEQLRRAMAEAEDANLAKDRFLANVSHELRTPLSGIMGLADVLASRLPKPEYQYFVRLIKDSAQSLNELLTEILDSARIKSGELLISVRPFKPRQMINRVVGLFRERAQKGGNLIRSRIDPAMPVVMSGDGERLEQILRNLVSNAVKFTRNGTIMVSTDCRWESPEHVTVSFKVRDTGPGIPEDKQGQLFDEFYQVENTLTKEHPGTGLGLSIARKLTEAMGGLIGVESRENEGATFFVEIGFWVPPDQTETEVEDLSDLDESASRPLKVLVAEDNRINQLYIRKMLENMGHRVTLVENGLDAINEVKANHYDAVLMDIQMPVMDGYTAIRNIRESDLVNRRVPIYALTAYASEKDAEKALAAGADGHIIKPVDFENLQWLLHQKAGKAVAKDLSRQEQRFPSQQDILNRFSKNPALYLDLLEKIRNDLPKRMARLKEILVCKDFSEAARECHTLAGIAATIGDQNLWKIGMDSEAQLTNASKSDDFTEQPQIEDAADGALRYLDNLIDKLSESTVAQQD